MPAHGRLSFARLLAPLALIVFTVAVVAIVMGSGVTGDDSGDGSAGAQDIPAATTGTTTTKTTGQKQKKVPRSYTIKANDTLSGIAERFGTTVEELQALNPALDPQGLVAGQKIKLRE
jgi:LysM repeat protein